MAYLTRRYRFCASHRLHNEALSDDANLRIYGKCDSAFGHGHNYVLEVTVKGPIDQETGMVFDLVVLDGVVQTEVLDRLDHTNLNLDVENFRFSSADDGKRMRGDIQSAQAQGRQRWTPSRRPTRARAAGGDQL